MLSRLESFGYDYLSGPLPTPEEISAGFVRGNCRRAVQYFYWKVYSLFLEPDAVLPPAAYRQSGIFIDGGELLDPSTMHTGDVIYAEANTGKIGQKLRRRREHFDSEEEWLIRLHTAVYVGEDAAEHPLIWHATSIEGGTCAWTIERFREYYRPVAVKRILAVSQC